MFFFFFKQKTAYEMQRSLVGSEMCIRDRTWPSKTPPVTAYTHTRLHWALENTGSYRICRILATRACVGAARALKMAARVRFGATMALEMAARPCFGAARALKMADRPCFGAATPFQKAARPCFRAARALEMAVRSHWSRHRCTLLHFAWLIFAPCMDMHGFALVCIYIYT